MAQNAGKFNQISIMKFIKLASGKQRDDTVLLAVAGRKEISLLSQRLALTTAYKILRIFH